MLYSRWNILTPYLLKLSPVCFLGCSIQIVIQTSHNHCNKIIWKGWTYLKDKKIVFIKLCCPECEVHCTSFLLLLRQPLIVYFLMEGRPIGDPGPHAPKHVLYH